MRVVIVGDAFPPLRSSGAVQLRDLSVEFVRQGHDVTMMVASPELDVPSKIEDWKGVRVIRLKTAQAKDTGHVQRAISELMMPFLMLKHFRNSVLKNEKWEAVIWYSPTIFLGLFVHYLKFTSRCKSYLIIRDIFPEWAVDMGLMGRGLPYLFFKAVANYQYSVADVIGIQTLGNQIYFNNWLKSPNKKLEILHNWLAENPEKQCSISVEETSFAGRKIFVYAGNMGIAQGMNILIDLADQLKNREDIGFLFVGRGSESEKIRQEAKSRELGNVVFFEEIEPDEISGLYAQCHVGLISLDPRHRSHNIPGKFLSYMQSGLPVLASVNEGNDIVAMIETENIGEACTDQSTLTLKAKTEELLEKLENDENYADRCQKIYQRLYSPDACVSQIVSALSEYPSRAGQV